MVNAIREYTTRNGVPPRSLTDLLPAYDASVGGTGFPKQVQFDYHAWKDKKYGPNGRWILVVYTDMWTIDSGEINFDSEYGRWRVID